MIFQPYEGEQRDIRWVTITLAVIATALLSCRLVSTWKNRGWFGMEDVFVVAADIFLIGLAATIFTATTYGWGMRVADIKRTGGNVRTSMKCFFASQILYLMTITMNKLAFLTLYYRIFDIKPFRKACIVVMVVVVGYCIGFFFATMFQCTPMPKIFNLKGVKGHCINFVWQRWTNAVGNLLTDIIIFLLPVPVIWNLKMSLGNRLGLLVLFSMGFFICIITALRMATLPQSLKAKEPTWQSAPTNLWSFIEAAVGVICACLITLRKAITSFWPNQLKTKHSSSAKRYGPYGSASRFGHKPHGSRRLTDNGGNDYALGTVVQEGKVRMGGHPDEGGQMFGETYVNVTAKSADSVSRSESQEFMIDGITVTKDVRIMHE